MKFAVRGGHNFSVPGARGIIDETTEDRKVKDSVIKYLRALGHEVLDVTSKDTHNTVSSDLAYGIDKANNANVDMFISIHFNKAYTTYDGEIGTEVLVHDTSKTNTEANSVLKKIVSLGFKNRGVKQRSELSELKRTNMKAMIIEVCFVEATKDVELYKKVGYDEIGKKIAEGLAGKNVSSIPNAPSSPIKPKNNWIVDLQKELNINYGAKLEVDGIAGPKTLAECIILKKGSTGKIVKILQNRLISLGFSCGLLGSDGSFGAGTKNAVINFQKSKGLNKDGIVGKNTWAKLLDL